METMLLRESPKTLVHENVSMNSTCTNGQDAKDLNEIGRGKNNVVIWGMQEDKLDNILIENITNSLNIVLLC